jgi:two-component system, chemotaxis family, protein-glutamate methylesterase/glutaminase
VTATTSAERPAHSVVGVGASAGGVEALIRLMRGLPEDFRAVVLVVLHIPASGGTVLPSILGRQTRLPVALARDGEPLRSGRVLVAAPDRHLVVSRGHVHLARGPKENGVRPAVDPMLRSLADAYGAAAIAVVLSGALGDGSGGALAVAAAGGAVIVQDPADAIVSSMPESALASVGARARTLTAVQIGPELARLAAGRQGLEEVRMGTSAMDATRERPDGPPSGLTCPECGGALWSMPEGGGRRYRCRVGHAYSEHALVGAQAARVEASLWAALEVLEERAELLERMAARHGLRRPRTGERLRAAAADAITRADVIRTALAERAHAPDALGVDAEDVAAGVQREVG